MKNARRAAAAGHKTTQRRRRPPVGQRTALLRRRILGYFSHVVGDFSSLNIRQPVVFYTSAHHHLSTSDAIAIYTVATPAVAMATRTSEIRRNTN